VKILELHYEKNSEGEEYTIKTEQGISKLTAAAHMFRAVAEGLDEIQLTLLPLSDNIEESKKE